MDESQMNQVLDVIAQAWGPVDNIGYCFFPWIDRKEQVASKGKKGFHNGPAFEWPAQRDEVIAHMLEMQHVDLYWCPVIFKDKYRQEGDANEEYALWADLDEADPHRIQRRWKPSVTWETSPGRYQALWLLNDVVEEDLYGAARAGGENQLMTRMVGADPGGWDITQLLRIPGWVNHKPEYLVGGRRPEGKLLWNDGPRYDAVDFDDLPALPKGFNAVEFDEDLLTEVNSIDIPELAKRIGPNLPRRAQQLLKAKSVNGDDRSKTLWYLSQCLAEAECTVAEIIAMVRPTPWNKFDGRADELRRLGADAVAAVDSHELKIAGGPMPTKQDWGAGMELVKDPKWLIPGLFTQGSVGFVAGEPKTRKSWVGLDLAFSVAMAGDGINVAFLNHFPVLDGGPVLYMILEDALPVAKSRGVKIWESKREGAWGISLEGGEVVAGMDYMTSKPTPSIDFMGDCTLKLSQPDVMEWLSSVVGEGKLGTNRPYKLLIIDTLMRAAGDVDENRSLELMSKLLNPLTRLARKHRINILLIHHFKKQSSNNPTRGGQRMMGSQAFHAWAEDSLYVTADNGSLIFDAESKSAESSTHTFAFNGPKHTWSPTHQRDDGRSHPTELDFTGATDPTPRPGRKPSGKVILALQALGPGYHHHHTIASQASISFSQARNQLRSAALRNEVRLDSTLNLWTLP